MQLQHITSNKQTNKQIKTDHNMLMHHNKQAGG